MAPFPKFRRTLAAALLSVSFGVSADSVTDQARALMDQGKPDAAYGLLAPLEPERAGTVDYDLLLGIAALDSGRQTNAVFALERVLAAEPNNARARAEIARAYLALGETKAARREFETVQAQPVPPDVKEAIARYLSAIDEEDDQGRLRVRRFFELGFGHDTNVNAATSASEVAVPFFGGLPITLAAGGRRSSDNFFNLSGGANLRYGLGRDTGLSLLAGASGAVKSDFKLTEFDTGSVDGNLGLAYRQGKNQWIVSLNANTFSLDSNRYRDAVGLSGQWVHDYDKRTQTTAFLQYSDLNYPGQGFRNATRWIGGAGFAHALTTTKTVLFGSAYFGGENQRDGGRNDLGFSIAGLRAGGQYEIVEHWTLFGNLAFERRRHDGDDPFFLARRRDHQINLGVGLVWVPAKDWKVTPQIQHTRNDSNISIYDYTRNIYSVTLRRDF